MEDGFDQNTLYACMKFSANKKKRESSVSKVGL